MKQQNKTNMLVAVRKHLNLSCDHIMFFFFVFFSVCRTWLLWVMLCGMKFLFMIFVSAAFASTILFINNSVTFNKLGAINGLAVSMAAVTR